MNMQSPATEARVQQLLNEGAVPVWDFYQVADNGQAEVVLNERRFLITPNDDSFKKYTNYLDQAGLMHLVNDNKLGDEEVVVAEISRDSRTLPQLLRSHQPKDGYDLNDVFTQIGEHINRLETRQGLVPAAGSLSLNKILVVRNIADVMFTPKFELESFNDSSNEAIIENMTHQLLPRYAKFGAVALIESLKAGLEHGKS